MPDWLSKDKAPFLLALLLSMGAWSVNGLISEIGQRKLVQYDTKIEIGAGDARKFIVRIKNLSAKAAIDGAKFRIRPAPGKKLILIDKSLATITFPAAIDIQMPPVEGTETSGAQFTVPILPPDAAIEFLASFSRNDSPPVFGAYFTTSGGGEFDKHMRLVSSATLEAWLVRNQLIVYVVLSAVAAGLAILWVVLSWLPCGRATHTNG